MSEKTKMVISKLREKKEKIKKENFVDLKNEPDELTRVKKIHNAKLNEEH